MIWSRPNYSFNAVTNNSIISHSLNVKYRFQFQTLAADHGVVDSNQRRQWKQAMITSTSYHGVLDSSENREWWPVVEG